MRRFILALVGTAAAAFALDPPTALTVISATNRQVKLSWTAGGNAATQYLVKLAVPSDFGGRRHDLGSTAQHQIGREHQHQRPD
jgi:hypothetical protein